MMLVEPKLFIKGWTTRDNGNITGTLDFVDEGHSCFSLRLAIGNFHKNKNSISVSVTQRLITVHYTEKIIGALLFKTLCGIGNT